MPDWRWVHVREQNAFKCYLRTRDYCTTSKHILAMCLNVIRVSIGLPNFMNVSNYVQKAETTPDMSVRSAPACMTCSHPWTCLLQTSSCI